MIEECCHECKKTKEETGLFKCPTCFKRFCEEHTYRMSGRRFCTRGCAQTFFFAEPDKEDFVADE